MRDSSSLPVEARVQCLPSARRLIVWSRFATGRCLRRYVGLRLHGTIIHKCLTILIISNELLLATGDVCAR